MPGFPNPLPHFSLSLKQHLHSNSVYYDLVVVYDKIKITKDLSIDYIWAADKPEYWDCGLMAGKLEWGPT